MTAQTITGNSNTSLPRRHKTPATEQPISLKSAMTAALRSSTSSHGGRVPEALRSIFVEAWQGAEIHEPPKNGEAFKMFERDQAMSHTTPCKPLAPPHPEQQRKFRRKLTRNRSSDDADQLRGSSGHLSLFARQARRRSMEMGLGESPQAAAQDLSQSHHVTSSTCKKPSLPLLQHKKKANNFNNSSSHHGRPENLAKKKTSKKSAEAAAIMAAPPDSPKKNSLDVARHPIASAYPSQRSPQVFLDVMLRTRGYSIETFKTKETAYFNAPTPLQMASYHGRLQDLIRTQDVDRLRAVLSCGISSNPCNRHGESLLHTACRYGYDRSVTAMLECGANVSVSDHSGRTPLHNAFFGTQPSYETVTLLLRHDVHLLHLRDHLDSTPLHYIPRNQWGVWIDFLYSRRDEFWPRRNKRLDGIAQASPYMSQKPNSAPLPNPPNALPTELASMVAAGRLTPDEAVCLAQDGTSSDDDDDDDSYDDDDDDTCTASLTTASEHTYLLDHCPPALPRRKMASVEADSDAVSINTDFSGESFMDG